MLRKLVLATSKSGQLKKQDSYEAMNLINYLEKLSAFGTIGSVTTGDHKFKWDGKAGWTMKCDICGKDLSTHE